MFSVETGDELTPGVKAAAGQRQGVTPMLQHSDVWRGIDRLAAKHGLSASGLARRAGLDPTAFNPSKRITREGRPRWPSTESISKILTVTGESFANFVILTGSSSSGFDGGTAGRMAGRVTGGKSIPVIALERLSTETCFDSAGRPIGESWGRVNSPAINDRDAFAIEISGADLDPVYRDGDIVIASPASEVRRGDRVVIGVASGDVMLSRIGRQEADGLHLEGLKQAGEAQYVKNSDVRWIARIVWASQ